MQYESLNRYVLRLFLKAVTVSDDRMSTGRLFHASGPATTNARLQMYDTICYFSKKALIPSMIFGCLVEMHYVWYTDTLCGSVIGITVVTAVNSWSRL